MLFIVNTKIQYLKCKGYHPSYSSPFSKCSKSYCRWDEKKKNLVQFCQAFYMNIGYTYMMLL